MSKLDGIIYNQKDDKKKLIKKVHPVIYFNKTVLNFEQRKEEEICEWKTEK